MVYYPQFHTYEQVPHVVCLFLTIVHANIFILERDGDIVRYLEMIPPDNQYKLDEELDWDNDTDRDLTKIAQYITDWEANLRVPLELTETDVHKIQQEENPDTRQ